MASEDTGTLVRTWVDAWNRGDLDALGSLGAADFVRHDPTVPDVHGPAAEQHLAQMYRRAFPDLHFTIEHLVVEGDMATAHLTARGTHQGKLFDVPPTGSLVTIQVMELYRVAGGTIVEQWVVMDALGLMQQIGAIPAPAAR